jgi:hypothetical protein
MTIKQGFKELVKMYSNQESFFSKKRIESGVAFVVLQWGMVHWLVLNVSKISASDLFVWATVNVAISGYVVSQIQKEKKADAVS